MSVSDIQDNQIKADSLKPGVFFGVAAEGGEDRDNAFLFAEFHDERKLLTILIGVERFEVIRPKHDEGDGWLRDTILTLNRGLVGFTIFLICPDGIKDREGIHADPCGDAARLERVAVESNCLFEKLIGAKIIFGICNWR